MAKFLITSFLIALFASPLYGQIYSTQYRVPGQNWMEIKSERFRLIYPERYKHEAMRSMAILESDYERIQNLIGGELRNFPVIINPENDRSNGFVAPLNFRSEIELAPIIGKTMNPQSGDWLEIVLPHELVHALHFNVNPNSLTRMLGLFSPDARRSVHSAAPLGVFEGIAVHHESHGIIPNAGRGHHPYFRNQFNAHLNTRQEWSMGQLLHVTDYTPPFDRHYIGGYEFLTWLQREFGNDTVKQSIDFHYKYPIFGFGTALRRTTGYWPRQLHRKFSESTKKREAERLLSIRSPGTLSEKIQFPGTCRRLNRPLWVDDESILFYGRSCNRPTGFYRYQAENQTTKQLYEVSITPDFQYSLSDDGQYLIYSRYHTNTFYDNLFQGDLHQLHLETGHSERLTHNQRLFSPEWADGKLYARQIEASELKPVVVYPADGKIIQDFSIPDESSVVQIAVNPHQKHHAAVIGRVKSVQAIWYVNLSEDEHLFKNAPDIVFENGSVYDLSWHPSKEKFLFVSDHTGVMNLYQFDVPSREVVQLTDSYYNVFEASYSPNGKKIAYIGQHINEQNLYLLDVENALNRPVQRHIWTYNEQVQARLERPLMNREIEIDENDWDFINHNTGFGWLKPRLWTPLYERENGLDRIGMNFESADVMSWQSYSVGVNHYSGRIWYSAEYTNKRFYPGFRAELYNRPNFASFSIGEDEEIDTVTFLQQSQGIAFRMPIPLRFESNVRFSSLLLEPQYFLNRVRFFDEGSSRDAVSQFGTRHTIGFRSVLNYKIRQFSRDVQPNSGWALFAEARYGLNSDELQIEADEYTLTGNLTRRKGLRAGIIRYLAPLSRWNQSLRVSAQIYSQTDVPVFNQFSQVSDHFSELPLSGVNNAAMLDTRYTIPLTFPDDSGLLVPLYLSNIYLVLFSQTVTDLDSPDLVNASRSVFGAGIRSRFRLSNLAFDIGISIGWEPSRNEITTYFGNF